MDEEMIFLDNIMPVEIALKREIEYRRKVEAWRKQQQIDPKIDTLQLEVRFMKNGILILFCLWEICQLEVYELEDYSPKCYSYQCSLIQKYGILLILCSLSYFGSKLFRFYSLASKLFSSKWRCFPLISKYWTFVSLKFVYLLLKGWITNNKTCTDAYPKCVREWRLSAGARRWFRRSS